MKDAKCLLESDCVDDIMIKGNFKQIPLRPVDLEERGWQNDEAQLVFFVTDEELSTKALEITSIVTNMNAETVRHKEVEGGAVYRLWYNE